MKANLIVMAAAVVVGLFLNGEAFAQRRVVVWSEGTAPKAIYPNDINGAVAEGLACLDGWKVIKANLSTIRTKG